VGGSGSGSDSYSSYLNAKKSNVAGTPHLPCSPFIPIPTLLQREREREKGERDSSFKHTNKNTHTHRVRERSI